MKIIGCNTALTPEGWKRDIEIGIGDDGRIAHIRPRHGRADVTVDVVLPAPLNLHSHTFQRAMAGMTEGRGPSASDSFWTWRQLMYRFLDRLTPDHVEAIAALAFMEMLEAGYSSVAEFHYLHHGVGGVPYERLSELSDRIIAAAERTGIGLTILPVHYQYGGCDRRPLQGGQKRFDNDVDRYRRLHEEAAQSIARSHDDYRIGVAPHSLRAVDTDGLSEVVALGDGGPIHMHIAEQIAEVDEVMTHLGKRPVEWLLDNHAVDENWCLIHCTQMTADETDRLAATGAVAGLCPITESSLGDGIFNATRFFAASGKVGIGSDSNIHIALFDELKTLEYSQRLRDRSRAALATAGCSTGRVLFEATARGGAQAGGRASGAVEAGALADLIGIDGDNRWIGHLDGDAVLDGLIFGGFGQRCIRDVWSAGRHMVRDGRHVHGDEIVAGYRRVMAEIAGPA
ncbi:MAG: formimidoylglutamate deiminase [Rhizobiaceae bacterium]